MLLPAMARLGKEGNAFLFLLILIGALIACVFASCNEIRYTLSGKTVDAAIDRVYKVTSRVDPNGAALDYQISYSIEDPTLLAPGQRLGVQGAGVRHEADTVSAAWFTAHAQTLLDPEGKTVAVQYLSGSEGSSRLVGNTKRWVFIPVIVVLVLSAVFGLIFMRDFNRHQMRMRTQR